MKKDELEKVKAEYNKYIKIIKKLIIIFAIIASIILIKNIFKLGFAIKLVENNVWMDLGDNYKITEYDEETNEVIQTTYYKNNTIRITSNIGETTNKYITNDYKEYWIVPESKEYSIQSEDFLKIIYNPKVTLYALGEQFSNEIYHKKICIEKFMKHKFYIEKYNNKQYFVSDLGYNKYYFDLEDLIIKYITNGNDLSRYEIEKEVVIDEDVTLPDLSSYIKMDGSE